MLDISLGPAGSKGALPSAFFKNIFIFLVEYFSENSRKHFFQNILAKNIFLGNIFFEAGDPDLGTVVALASVPTRVGVAGAAPVLAPVV